MSATIENNRRTTRGCESSCQSQGWAIARNCGKEETKAASRYNLFLLALVSAFVVCLVFQERQVSAAGLEVPIKSIAQITLDEEGHPLDYPSAVFFDPDLEEIYLANGGSSRVVVYGPDFFPRLSIGRGRGVAAPRGGVVTSNGEVYICQIRNRDVPSARITILNGAFFVDREIFLDKIPDAGNISPRQVAVSRDGTIYLAGNTTRGVLVLDKEGNFLRWLKPMDTITNPKAKGLIVEDQQTEEKKEPADGKGIAVEDQQTEEKKEPADGKGIAVEDQQTEEKKEPADGNGIAVEDQQTEEKKEPADGKGIAVEDQQTEEKKGPADGKGIAVEDQQTEEKKGPADGKGIAVEDQQTEEKKEPADGSEALPPGEEDAFANIPEEFRPKSSQPGRTGGGPSEILGPVLINTVTIDSTGKIYLVSSETGHIYVYGPDENFLFSFGKKGGSPRQLSQPKALAVDEKRELIYVVDYMRHTILVYDLGGEYLFEIGGRGVAPGWFNFPSGIAIDNQGRIIVADLFNKRAQVLEVEYVATPAVLSKTPLTGSLPKAPEAEETTEQDALTPQEQDAMGAGDQESAGEALPEQTDGGTGKEGGQDAKPAGDQEATSDQEKRPEAQQGQPVPAGHGEEESLKAPE